MKSKNRQSCIIIINCGIQKHNNTNTIRKREVKAMKSKAHMQNNAVIW